MIRLLPLAGLCTIAGAAHAVSHDAQQATRVAGPARMTADSNVKSPAPAVTTTPGEVRSTNGARTTIAKTGAEPVRAQSFSPHPRQSVYFVNNAPGTIWVRGTTYKASFGAEGATYIPYLGSHAPRNFP